jgi:hypothetical protein
MRNNYSMLLKNIPKDTIYNTLSDIIDNDFVISCDHSLICIEKTQCGCYNRIKQETSEILYRIINGKPLNITKRGDLQSIENIVSGREHSDEARKVFSSLCSVCSPSTIGCRSSSGINLCYSKNMKAISKVVDSKFVSAKNCKFREFLLFAVTVLLSRHPLVSGISTINDYFRPNTHCFVGRNPISIRSWYSSSFSVTLSHVTGTNVQAALPVRSLGGKTPYNIFHNLLWSTVEDLLKVEFGHLRCEHGNKLAFCTEPVSKSRACNKLIVSKLSCMVEQILINIVRNKALVPVLSKHLPCKGKFNGNNNKCKDWYTCIATIGRSFLSFRTTLKLLAEVCLNKLMDLRHASGSNTQTYAYAIPCHRAPIVIGALHDWEAKYNINTGAAKGKFMGRPIIPVNRTPYLLDLNL